MPDSTTPDADPASIAAYDYDLPPELIATHPANERTGSRLLVLPRTAGDVRHRTFADLGDELRAGDRLVVNDTFVVPARLEGRRDATGGRWSGLAVTRTAEPLEAGEFVVLAKTKGKPQPGETVTLPGRGGSGGNSSGGSDSGSDSGGGGVIELRRRLADGAWVVAADGGRDRILADCGLAPLPPYILKQRSDASADAAADLARYQTVYATRSGGDSVAAPTAGLHFSEGQIDELKSAGIGFSRVRLDVGEGTFKPVSADRLDDHTMHSETVSVTEQTLDRIAETRQRGGRVIAVGTTAARALEASGGQPLHGPTELFIRPGYEFQLIDGLLTNFHLPKSTLLVMIAALAGRERVLATYREAIASGYRFFSYGDAMLIIDS